MATTSDRPVALIVLDGWGYRAEREGNAIVLANTPAWDRLSGLTIADAPRSVGAARRAPRQTNGEQ